MQTPRVVRCLALHVLVVVFFLTLSHACILFVSPAGAAEKASPPSPSAGEQSDVATRIAGLSDEDARKLLLDVLGKASSPSAVPQANSHIQDSFLAGMLDTLSAKSDISEHGARQLLDSIPGFLPDMYRIFLKLCPYGTSHGAMKSLLWVLFYLFMGFLLERVFNRLVINRLFLPMAVNNVSSAMSGIDKLMSCLVREIPAILGILIFFFAAYIIYFSFIWTDSPNVQLFFLALLLSITCIRVIGVFSRILFAPQTAPFRLLPMNCQLAGTLYRALVVTFGYILVAFMFGLVLQKLGALDNSVKFFYLLAASLLLAITAFSVLLYRTRIRDNIILAPSEYVGDASWGRKQFAAIWHLLAIAYLCVLWILLFNDLIDPDIKHRGAFVMSFFVVPIWMVCDKLLQWLVKYTMGTLKIYQDLEPTGHSLNDEDQIRYEQGKRTYLKAMNVARVGLVIILLVWIASLWNIYIPVFSNLSGVVFDSLLILTVAIFFWQFISSWIERKIQASIPDESEKKDSDEEDWGAAAKRGRSYTLLPMLRRFIGTVLVTMVTMTILSSMGVDIGPLLAGAGVVGLAVGFGAQKLVADMFSGFFYLLDDAFRVGEYIEAGGITGTVENISLRNVMLRHHRGMLQIVPHSELGAITNYMRGGLIVKFNLDFPYDADIDQIRKIIKKVGQTMQENEEFKNDFIRPLKSQGVREITNSVMTIRVKFTAKPGAHFLIRREAYKRITEALRAKGIHYAHRKVIVDIPPQPGSSEEQIAAMAGAAAQKLIEQENPPAEVAETASQ